MVCTAIGKIFKIGRAGTRYLMIPAAVAGDSAFPFETGEEVVVRIEGRRLVVESIEE